MRNIDNDEFLLPPYVLAIFDGEGDGTGDGDGDGEGDGSGSGESGGSGDGDQGGSGDGGGNSGGDGNKGARGKGGDQNRGGQRGDGDRGTRDGEGRFVSTADYERRIHELNESDKNRRIENKNLRASVGVLEQRAIRIDAEKALTAAGAVDDDVVELFLSQNSDHIKVDRKTGKTLGLDRLTDWKKAHPKFFESSDGDGDGQGDGDGSGAGSSDGDAEDGKGGKGGKGAGGAGDGKDGKGKGRNSTANGGSQGSGSGAGGNSGGLPDLRGMNAEERAQAMRDYRRSLRGAGGGYGKAVSKQRSA